MCIAVHEESSVATVREQSQIKCVSAFSVSEAHVKPMQINGASCT